MCCGKSIRGKQGDEGPAGADGTNGGPEVTQVIVGTTSISASTDITLIASATQGGSLAYYGQIQVTSSDSTFSFIMTVTPLVNGVAQASKALVAQVVTPLVNLVIPVSDLQAIIAGNSFKFRITLSSYVSPPDVKLRLNYSYQ